MTIWIPQLDEGPGHPYQRLARAIIASIHTGDLKPGERLPPQRDLAYALKVSVGAVGRAYGLARARGLLVGEVGRGTYVAGPNNNSSTDDFSSPVPQALKGELRRNLPPDVGQGLILKELTQQYLERWNDPFLDYNPAGGTPYQREAGVQWLNRFGVTATRENIILCNGAHQAVTIALLTATKPGDLVVCDYLTYKGIRQVATIHQRKLEGVLVDPFGMLPEALEEVCSRKNVSAVFLTPTFQNPTASLMPLERRKAIVSLAKKYNFNIIEDDVYAALLASPSQTLQSLAPERVFYANGLSKSLAPGLRTAFLMAPAQFKDRAQAIQHNMNLGQSPLIADLVATFISNGAVEEILAAQRSEVAKRFEVASAVFANESFSCHKSAIHAWLVLPEHWRARAFADAALDHGISLTVAEEYAIGRQTAPQAVRLALGAPKTMRDLKEALSVLRSLLSENPVERTEV